MSAVLCLGEPVVDLIAQDGIGARPRYTPHFGGAIAVAAVVAARAGARVAIGGAVGGDRWGPWLRERLTAEGVDDAWLVTRPGAATQQVVVDVAQDGEPHYALREPPAEVLSAALGQDPSPALQNASGLVMGTDTLAGPADRAVAMGVRESVLAAEQPLILAADLHLDRWASRTDAVASVNACVPQALLVVAGAAQAALLTGEDDPERAARALRKAGARVVAITLDRDGALVRGPGGLRLDARAVTGASRSAVGATAMVTGTLLAALERSGYYPDAAAAALDDAVAAVTRCGTHWGALD